MLIIHNDSDGNANFINVNQSGKNTYTVYEHKIKNRSVHCYNYYLITGAIFLFACIVTYLSCKNYIVGDVSQLKTFVYALILSLIYIVGGILMIFSGLISEIFSHYFSVGLVAIPLLSYIITLIII